MGDGGRKAGGRVEKELAGDDVYVGRGGRRDCVEECAGQDRRVERSVVYVTI